jgi:CPA1 family monovalent cation:H+ antiporter
MRGVVSLAAALALPDDFPGRDFVLASTFAVILVTVLIQGATLASLIRVLGLGGFTQQRLKTAAPPSCRIDS